MLTIKELNWAPGHYQWECADCHSVGNITPPMISQPSATWHNCPVRKAEVT